MLRATNLSKSYKELKVVDAVSLNVLPGTIVGLLGPNGAGKTTCVGMLYGAVLPDLGTVEIAGIDLQRNPRKARTQIGVVPQEDNLDPDFNAEENIWRFATYYGFSIPQAKKRADELLTLARLDEHRKKGIDQLSGGLKRRLILARALINNPKLIFLDEPTTGLDPDVRQDFWRLVLELKKSGTTFLVTTHYMEEAERLCDTVLLIQRGRILDEDNPANLIKKYVGAEVVEVNGLTVAELSALPKDLATWSRPYGDSIVLGVRSENEDELVMHLRQLSPTKLLQRKANLEDVFLTLTGDVLG